jgi:hypothetical protein
VGGSSIWRLVILNALRLCVGAVAVDMPIFLFDSRSFVNTKYGLARNDRKLTMKWSNCSGLRKNFSLIL